MSRAPTPPRSPLVSMLVVGSMALVLGVLIGMSLGGESAPVSHAATSAPRVEALLEDVTRDLATLRQAVQRLELPAPPPPVPLEPAQTPEERGGEASEAFTRPPDLDLEQIEQRLSTIESLQGQLLAMGQSSRPAASMPEIPPGVPVRSYLRALKEGGGSVAEAHMLWDAGRVRARYGPPDVIEIREDYIEWIYWLAEEGGQQFDFHFVDDLCVEAH